MPARLLEALLDPHAGMQMWFLAVLFWMFVVFTLARLVSRSDRWIGAVAIAVAAIGFLPRFTVMGIDKVAWLYPFFVAGYLISRNRKDPRALAFIGAGAAAAMVAAVAFGGSVLATHYVKAFALTGAVAGLYAVLPRGALAPQAWLGRRTLGVYGAQMVVMPFLIVGAGWWGALASCALVACAATLVSVALERIPVARSVFLGQWPRGGHRAGREPDPV
jgi:peptidoglycan/LPS O-acetylase OafA/YrhL